MSTNNKSYQLQAEGARFYEENFVPALFRNWARLMVKTMDLQHGDRMLDVACGTGILARTAFESPLNHLDIFGCDINEGMLEVAKNANPEINWFKGEAENLPFENNFFDKVGCQLGFMFFNDQIRSLNEMLRVSKENGRIFLSVLNVIEENTAYLDFLEILEDIGGEDLGNILRSPFSYGERGLLDRILRSSEITSFEFLGGREFAEFQSIKHWIDCDVKASPIAGQITSEQYTELHERAKKSLKKYVGQDGKVRFPMSAHMIIIE